VVLLMDSGSRLGLLLVNAVAKCHSPAHRYRLSGLVSIRRRLQTAYRGRRSGWLSAQPSPHQAGRSICPSARSSLPPSVPSPGGQVSGMARAWQPRDSQRVGTVRCHPADLPKGYQAAQRGQAWHTQPAVRPIGCPRRAAWSGDARSTGWQLARLVDSEQIRSKRPISVRHQMTRDNTNVHANAQLRHRPDEGRPLNPA